jgi:hypothetical protein
VRRLRGPLRRSFVPFLFSLVALVLAGEGGPVTDLPRLALSLKQPWAYAVMHLGKDVENRVWFRPDPGPVWIAASQQVTRRYFDQAVEIIKTIAPGAIVPPIDALPYGCIVGRANIVDVALPGGWRWSGKVGGKHRPGFGYDPTRAVTRHPSDALRWHFDDQYGYLLEDRRALARVLPCKGHQRWWVLPAPLLERLKGAA